MIVAFHFFEIDRIWTTLDVTIANACIMLAEYVIGNHILFVVDLHTSLLVGPVPPREQQAALRRLNTCLSQVGKKCTENLEENLRWHRLIKKLGDAHFGGMNKEDIGSKIKRLPRIACSL